MAKLISTRTWYEQVSGRVASISQAVGHTLHSSAAWGLAEASAILRGTTGAVWALERERVSHREMMATAAS